jgi:hypothetical protein
MVRIALLQYHGPQQESMMLKFLTMAGLSMMVGVTAVRAAEPLTIVLEPPKTLSIQAAQPQSRPASYETVTPAVRVAMCGVEADAGNTSLDAGLIDFKLRDTTRTASNWSEDPRSAGKSAHDYQSPVFLGVTLGYHF